MISLWVSEYLRDNRYKVSPGTNWWLYTEFISTETIALHMYIYSIAHHLAICLFIPKEWSSYGGTLSQLLVRLTKYCHTIYQDCDIIFFSPPYCHRHTIRKKSYITAIFREVSKPRDRVLILNMIDCFKDYNVYIYVLNRSLDLAWPKSGTAMYVVCPTQLRSCLLMHWRL